MGLVYCIHCNETGENYIGSTIQLLEYRISRHLLQTDCTSRQILDRNNYDVSILEDNVNENILRIREQFYMDCCDKLVNKQRAYRTVEQACQQKKEADKRYADKTKWKRQIKYTCECGTICNYVSRHRHFRTKNHQQYLTHKLNVITVPS